MIDRLDFILILKTHATVAVGCIATLKSQKRATILHIRTAADSLSGNKLNTQDCSFLEARIGISSIALRRFEGKGAS
ncbi:hypothetical protein [Microcoleus sp. LEGE 07076]|uniref:hypothetical protein n=1 Tax=Microcoleus sp. LEGE 07076 TaxID=915322 RepID=UPI0030D8E529